MRHLAPWSILIASVLVTARAQATIDPDDLWRLEDEATAPGEAYPCPGERCGLFRPTSPKPPPLTSPEEIARRARLAATASDDPLAPEGEAARADRGTDWGASS